MARPKTTGRVEYATKECFKAYVKRYPKRSPTGAIKKLFQDLLKEAGPNEIILHHNLYSAIKRARVKKTCIEQGIIVPVWAPPGSVRWVEKKEILDYISTHPCCNCGEDGDLQRLLQTLLQKKEDREEINMRKLSGFLARHRAHLPPGL